MPYSDCYYDPETLRKPLPKWWERPLYWWRRLIGNSVLPRNPVTVIQPRRRMPRTMRPRGCCTSFDRRRQQLRGREPPCLCQSRREYELGLREEREVDLPQQEYDDYHRRRRRRRYGSEVSWEELDAEQFLRIWDWIPNDYPYLHQVR